MKGTQTLRTLLLTHEHRCRSSKGLDAPNASSEGKRGEGNVLEGWASSTMNLNPASCGCGCGCGFRVGKRACSGGERRAESGVFDSGGSVYLAAQRLTNLYHSCSVVAATHRKSCTHATVVYRGGCVQAATCEITAMLSTNILRLSVPPPAMPLPKWARRVV